MSESIEKVFEALYLPVSKAVGQCLRELPPNTADATTLLSAVLAPILDLAVKSNKHDLNVNFEVLTKFIALMLVDNWELPPEVTQHLQAIISHRSKPNLQLLN